MRLTISSLIIAASAAIATPAFADIVHDCAKTPSLTINEGDGHYKFVGACTKIVLNGGDNTLSIESVKSLSVTGTDNTIDIGTIDSLSVTGVDNKITYRSGITSKLPKLSILGTGNQVSRLKP